MHFSFDGFNRYEIPTLVLANPNFEELHVIRHPKALEASIRFNGISDLSFYVDKTQDTKHFFDMLVKKRLIHVDGFGWFVILDTQLQLGPLVPRKQVNCVSYEATLASRPMNIAAGTYVFYNPAQPEGTLLYEIFNQVLSWNVGYVTPSLYGKARTFDMPDTNVHTFLTSDAAEAYECVFLFDNETRTVSAYTVDELVKDSGVMMRFDTIMKSAQISETRDEIVTALSVYGASEFSINNVNPLGTPTIYKFDHYKDMMTPELWDVVREWEALVQSQTVPYANILTELKQRNVDLLVLQADLAKMQYILDSGKQVRDVQTPYNLQSSSNSAATAMSAWIDATEPSILKTLILTATAYPGISLDNPPDEIAGYASSVATPDRGIVQALINIWACERIMVLQEADIASMNLVITDLRESLVAINAELSFENNFSLEQREELEKYIFGTDFVNEYCVIGDYMTYPEIQDIAMELLEQGRNVLNRISKPTYEFDLDAVNYLFNKKYEGFINQTRLGSLVHAEIEEDNWVSPVLLEVNLNWSQPDNFTMTFGNRYKLQSSEYLWADLNEEMSRVSASVSSEFSSLIAPSRNGMNDSVSALLNGVWDASKNAVLAGDNQSLIIDRHGLMGRRMLLDSNGNPTGFYDPRQFRMINNKLVFTDDNWQNCRLALGEIDMGDGTSAYGLAADVIIGTLIAGTYFVFTNEAGSYRFDGEGATLTNASFSVISENNLARIYMDAINGFRIQTRTSIGDDWEDRFYTTPDGDLIVAGRISASSGNIGGWLINDGDLGGLSYNNNTLYLGVNPITTSINGHGNVSLVFKAGSNFGVGANGTMYAYDARFSSGTFSGGSFNSITANGGTFNNIYASGGTFNNITASGNITANSIAAYSSISSPNISGGSISASTITGGTISSSELYSAFGSFTYLVAANGSVFLYPGYVSFAGVQIGAVPNYSDTCIIPPYNGYGNVGTGPNSGNPRAWDIVYANRLYGTVSSGSMRKLKENIRPVDYDSDRFDKLEPVVFNLKADSRKLDQLGVIAEDVMELYPELVETLEGQDGGETYLALAYDRIPIVLIHELQKARKCIASLEDRLTALERLVTK